MKEITLGTSKLRSYMYHEIQEKRSRLAFPEGVCRRARVPRRQGLCTI
jgi:hypothetical protein